jgi:hypothetical protein
MLHSIVVSIKSLLVLWNLENHWTREVPLHLSSKFGSVVQSNATVFRKHPFVSIAMDASLC